MSLRGVIDEAISQIDCHALDKSGLAMTKKESCEVLAMGVVRFVSGRDYWYVVRFYPG
ncbi:MAG TPA: hypothetical protein PK263_04110 [bacterium]|nr:hypothetical protein [bacterium]